LKVVELVLARAPSPPSPTVCRRAVARGSPAPVATRTRARRRNVSPRGEKDRGDVKREELLQFAQGAISGLKLNADITRSSIGLAFIVPSALKKALAEVRICSRFEDLLLKKKKIKSGESLEIHSQKVRLLFCCLRLNFLVRHQKEEALNFRVAKANEVSEVEKELLAEIAGLEKQRDELEVQLKKVNISLAAVVGRLNKTREERDQFDEASNQIVLHLKTKKMRLDFESIERPFLEIEVPEKILMRSEDESEKGSPVVRISSPPKFKGVDSPKSSPPVVQISTSPKSRGVYSPKSSPRIGDEILDPESEIAKLEMEFGKVGRDYSTDEIGGWEFDELEQEVGAYK
ncbi:hypothetical protein BHE74_00026413, partial [Ensete ventricosum]